MKPLEGHLIRLRAPEMEDLDVLYQWENNTDIWLVSNTIVPFSKHILKKYIETAHLDIFETHQLRFMIETIDNDKQTIGTIDLFDFDPYHLRAGVGVLIAEDNNRGKGYAYDALKTMVRYAFTTLKLHQLYCQINPLNEPSINLFKHTGFVITGEKKDWIWTNNGWASQFFFQLINPL
jgi:diamine N-acetyltransferase